MFRFNSSFITGIVYSLGLSDFLYMQYGVFFQVITYRCRQSVIVFIKSFFTILYF